MSASSFALGANRNYRRNQLPIISILGRTGEQNTFYQRGSHNCSEGVTWKYTAFTFGKDNHLTLLQAGMLMLAG